MKKSQNGVTPEEAPPQSVENPNPQPPGQEGAEREGGEKSTNGVTGQESEKAPSPAYRIEQAGDRIVVHAPYNGTFIELARAAEGKYDVDQRTWSFPPSKKQLVKEMCAYAYEGKMPKARLKKAMAVQKASSALLALKFGCMAFAFGLKGLRGMQAAQYLLKLFGGGGKGGHPVPRPLRVRGGGHGYAPMNMGGQELFLERSGIGPQR